MRKALKIAALVAGAVVGILVIGLAINHKLTRFEVASHLDADGIERFEHEDPQTTRILNYLCGMVELEESEIHEYFVDCLMYIAKQEGIDLDRDHLAGLTVDEIDRHISSIHQGTNPGTLKELYRVHFRTKYVAFSEENYQALWGALQSCGNPKVRFMTKPPIIGDNHQPNYLPFNNTAYIPLALGCYSGPVGSLYAELAHADQFSDNPAYWYLRSCLDFGQIAMENMTYDEDKIVGPMARANRLRTKGFADYFAVRSSGLRLRQNMRDPFFTYPRDPNIDLETLVPKIRPYYRPGAMEHNAHQVREPEIINAHRWEYVEDR